MKDYAGFDRLRASNAMNSMYGDVFEFIDTSRGVPARLYRSASDVKIFEPPKKKDK